MKLIYIDPPYNTGGDFIYPDDYAEGLASYQLFTRQVNEEGHKLTTNVNTSGRYHSRWLTMMYPRLFLARNLLREDGVIFVSIDDHEVHNLRFVMDEIFGEENFVASFVRRRRLATGMRETPVSPDHEYVVCFARLAAQTKLFGKAKNPADYPLRDDIGSFRSTDLTVGMTKEMRPNQFYPIKSPNGGTEYWPTEDRVWRFEPSSMQRHIVDRNIIWPDADPESRMSRPRFKTRFSASENERSPISTWIASSAAELSEYDSVDTLQGGLNQEATKQLRYIFGEQVLEYPKPVSLIKLITAAATRDDDLVLDFFAGSGTTAHAVLELNKEDGGNRKFILVQLPEPTGRKDFPTIAEITKERVRRVSQKMVKEDERHLALADGPKPDRGFKVFKLAPSNFTVWDPALAATEAGPLAEQWQLTADNVRPDVQEQALLHELMLKCGLPLASRVESATAGGTLVFRLDEGKLLVCLARELTRDALHAMIALKPQSVLCLDVGFRGNDALKVNAQLEFQSHDIQFRTA